MLYIQLIFYLIFFVRVGEKWGLSAIKSLSLLLLLLLFLNHDCDNIVMHFFKRCLIRIDEWRFGSLFLLC
jgi:hypothetical protein